MRRRIVIERAERLHQIPPYPTHELERYKKRLAAQGIESIDLTVGTLETTASDTTITRLCTAVQELSRTAGHGGPISLAFQEAFSAWFARRFDVDLDPVTQVLPLVGSKTGVACVPMALVNPGEVVLVPDPAYPAYRTATILAGGNVQAIPLVERNDFLPNLRQIEPSIAHQAKLMFLSYPNNPTGAVADFPFFREVVEFARRNNIIVCHDATHFFITDDEYDAPSFLQAPGASDVGFEIFSLSALLGGAPWELGVAVGNPSSLAALSQLTNNMDASLFLAVQQAGIDALNNAESQIAASLPCYVRRRNILVDGLQSLGWKIRKPKAGVYVWAPVPPRYTSVRFSVLLRKAGVFVVPGAYMGEFGEGYIRFALNVSEDQLHEVVHRIEHSMSRHRRLRRLQSSQFSLA